MEIHDSYSAEQTKQFAASIAASLASPAIMCLYGELGSGKTVFTKGFAAGLGISEKQIKSPTYTFLREYHQGRLHFYHFDFYRLEHIDDLMAHDLAEIFQKKNIRVVIEWAERVEAILPKNVLKIFFNYLDENTRRIIILP